MKNKALLLFTLFSILTTSCKEDPKKEETMAKITNNIFVI